jgi:hypothetical protein
MEHMKILIGIIAMVLMLNACAGNVGDLPTGELDNHQSLQASLSLEQTSANVAASSVSSDDPPKNPSLADSPYPINHGNSYQQDSTSLAGPTSSTNLDNYVLTTWDCFPEVLNYTSPYPNGDIVAWGSTALTVVKYLMNGPGGPKKITSVTKQTASEFFAHPISGAYTLIDNKGRFYAPAGKFLYQYQDSTLGDSRSGIKNTATFTLTDQDDYIVGLNMTYDGRLVVATNKATVYAIDYDNFSNYTSVAVGDGKEQVSNSIAVDEDGGIYMVTSSKMYKVVWKYGKLYTDNNGAWSAAYNAGIPGQLPPGRLGPGSGSTPTLMGTRKTDDRLVVITDGNQLMNIVFFWRDDIPAHWGGIAGKDRRIAAQMPVDFSDKSAKESVSEQSVVVRGYGAAVVNNKYGSGFLDIPTQIPCGKGGICNLLNNFFKILSYRTIYFSNSVSIAPYGVQKFEWNPDYDVLTSPWSNPDISCPNGIPTMSAASNLFYCVGQRKNKLPLINGGEWNIEALSWSDGTSSFYQPLGYPRFQYNSFYSALEIGPDGSMAYGAVTGIVQLRQR